MSAVLSLRLPEETKQRLDALSARTRRPAAVYVREALDAYLEDLEDAYLAAEVSRQVHSGEQPVHEWADVMRELGFDDLAEPAAGTPTQSLRNA